MRMHFHTDFHDIGYLPDADGVITHVTIDGALHDVTGRAEVLIDSLSQQDPNEVIRGQQFAETPITVAHEITALDDQMKSILDSIKTDEDYTATVARQGLLIVVDDGLAVIELTPCSEAGCDIYRKEWID